MISQGQNPKYLQKLGIIQRQIDAAQNTQTDHALTLIDGLCDEIRNGQEVLEFTKLLKQLNIIETSHDHAQITQKIQPDVPVRLVEEYNSIPDRGEIEREAVSP